MVIQPQKITLVILQRQICQQDTLTSNSSSFLALKRTIQRASVKSYAPITNPLNLGSLIISDDYCNIKLFYGYVENLIKYDSGPESDNSGIIIFSTQKNMYYFEKSSDIFLDGKFSIVPSLFFQLYTVHSFIGNKLQTIIYALLPSKISKIYNELFHQIKILIPSFTPSRIIIDFEMSSFNSLKISYQIQ